MIRKLTGICLSVFLLIHPVMAVAADTEVSLAYREALTESKTIPEYPDVINIINFIGVDIEDFTYFWNAEGYYNKEQLILELEETKFHKDIVKGYIQALVDAGFTVIRINNDYYLQNGFSLVMLNTYNGLSFKVQDYDETTWYKYYEQGVAYEALKTDRYLKEYAPAISLVFFAGDYLSDYSYYYYIDPPFDESPFSTYHLELHQGSPVEALLNQYIEAMAAEGFNYRALPFNQTHLFYNDDIIKIVYGGEDEISAIVEGFNQEYIDLYFEKIRIAEVLERESVVPGFPAVLSFPNFALLAGIPLTFENLTLYAKSISFIGTGKDLENKLLPIYLDAIQQRGQYTVIDRSSGDQEAYFLHNGDLMVSFSTILIDENTRQWQFHIQDYDEIVLRSIQFEIAAGKVLTGMEMACVVESSFLWQEDGGPYSIWLTIGGLESGDIFSQLEWTAFVEAMENLITEYFWQNDLNVLEGGIFNHYTVLVDWHITDQGILFEWTF